MAGTQEVEPIQRAAAIEMLRVGKIGRWNRLRNLAPNWRPNLAGADFQGIFFREWFDKYDVDYMNGCDLRNVDLSGANLAESNIHQTTFENSDLQGADLSGAYATGTNLSGANLSQARLVATSLGGAHLKAANLSEADLRKAILANADLAEADLSRADLRGANLNGAVLDNALLTSADLRNAKNLTKGQIEAAKDASRLKFDEDKFLLRLPQFPPPIFFSYAWSDKTAILAVDQWLRNKGARVILDERDFFVGENLRSEIIRCIQQAGVVVCFVSQSSKNRP